MLEVAKEKQSDLIKLSSIAGCKINSIFTVVCYNEATVFSSSIQKENTMSITKTKNETYRLRIYIPEEVKASLGIDKKVIEKRFKLRSEAKKYELELQNKIDKILSGDSTSQLERTGSIQFKEFYHQVWWESYKAGQTTSTLKPPSQATIDGTEIVFRKHILPMLGNYSIDEDLYLSQLELQAWFTAFEEDLKNDKILFKDYVLFYTTFFLGDRKSESYALQWKHIDINKQEIQLIQALDKYKNPKSTKGNKKTTFQIPTELADLLQSWKKQQKSELAKFGIIQSDEQYVFTYVDMKGNVNSPLHADYLNNKMKSVKRRHKELTHATPHKLRHTGATLAKQAGTSLEAISEALTHSDTFTTKTYVNTSNVVPMAVGEIAYRNLKK